MERSRPWAILIVLCLGTFAILLDTTIVNVALPSLITSLHASLDQALWVVNGYLLVFCALLIVASRLGDRYGRRRLFVAGLALFAVASALCGAAQNPAELVAARILQGFGAAALAPQPMAIIQDVFPRERMGAAFGIFSSMVGLAAVSGPVVGGILTSYLSWRWVFYVNLPIAAAGIVLALRLVPEAGTRHRHRFDLTGVVLSTTGLAAVVFGLIEGQRYHWGTIAGLVSIPAILAAGVLVLAAFVVWEHRVNEPLMPLGLFGDRTFTIMVVLNVVVQFALQSMLLVNSINLQSVLGFSAVRAGLTGLPLTIGPDRAGTVRRTAHRPVRRQVRAVHRPARVCRGYRGSGPGRFGRRDLTDVRTGPAGGRPGHGCDLRAAGHDGHARRSAAAGRRGLGRAEHRPAARRHPGRRRQRRGPGLRPGQRGPGPGRGRRAVAAARRPARLCVRFRPRHPRRPAGRPRSGCRRGRDTAFGPGRGPLRSATWPATSSATAISPPCALPWPSPSPSWSPAPRSASSCPATASVPAAARPRPPLRTRSPLQAPPLRTRARAGPGARPGN